MDLHHPSSHTIKAVTYHVHSSKGQTCLQWSPMWGTEGQSSTVVLTGAEMR
jgi:hypothetical protein